MDTDNKSRMRKDLECFAKETVDGYTKKTDEEGYPSIEELFAGYSEKHEPEEAFSDMVGKEEI